MLSDDILLDIFDSCRDDELEDELPSRSWDWDSLVHVCGRWRQIVFASPHRLRLRLRCTHRTPVRSHLSCWPAFPIVICYNILGKSLDPSDEDNLIAALELEHSNRVCVLDLYLTTTQLVKLVTVLQQSYPALTHLTLKSDLDAPVLPSGFLGGSAPCLQELWLEAIPFPALPTLLLSASHLVELYLHNVPKTGYISPEALVVGLAALTRLRSLYIRFRSTNPRTDRMSLPPVTRTVLPALTSFEFQGDSDYLEDLVARIDCPQLNSIDICYLHQLFGFRVAQLFEFINRSEDPQLSQFGWLDLRFVSSFASTGIALDFRDTRHNSPIQIFFPGSRWKVSRVVQVFGQFSAKLSDVRHLSIEYDGESPRIDHDEWVQLLHPFTAVQTLDLSTKHGGYYIPIRHTGETFADVLPALGLFYSDCPQVEFFEQFIAACRHTGRPVTVVRSPNEFYERLDSYLSEQDKDSYESDSSDM